MVSVSVLLSSIGSGIELDLYGGDGSWAEWSQLRSRRNSVRFVPARWLALAVGGLLLTLQTRELRIHCRLGPESMVLLRTRRSSRHDRGVPANDHEANTTTPDWRANTRERRAVDGVNTPGMAGGS